MYQADAELPLWLANQRIAQDYREAELASLVRHTGRRKAAIRRRAGVAIIAFGERLAGESGSMGKRRRMAARSL